MPLNKEIITDCLEILGSVQTIQPEQPCLFADQPFDGDKNHPTYIPLYLDTISTK